MWTEDGNPSGQHWSETVFVGRLVSLNQGCPKPVLKGGRRAKVGLTRQKRLPVRREVMVEAMCTW